MAAITTNTSRRIPKHCHHKATGLAVVRVNGHDVYCGKFGSAEAKAKYDRLISEWLQRGRVLPQWITGTETTEPSNAEYLPPVGMSIAELLLAYKFHTDDYY